MRTVSTLHVLIQMLDGNVGCELLPPFFLQVESDLDEFRRVLLDGPMGSDENDIFFPSWTKSIHVVEKGDIPLRELSNSQIEEFKRTVETDNELNELLDKEENTPGSVGVVLQQCRSARYSRNNQRICVKANVQNRTVSTQAGIRGGGFSNGRYHHLNTESQQLNLSNFNESLFMNVIQNPVQPMSSYMCPAPLTVSGNSSNSYGYFDNRMFSAYGGLMNQYYLIPPTPTPNVPYVGPCVYPVCWNTIHMNYLHVSPSSPWFFP